MSQVNEFKVAVNLSQLFLFADIALHVPQQHGVDVKDIIAASLAAGGPHNFF